MSEDNYTTRRRTLSPHSPLSPSEVALAAVPTGRARYRNSARRHPLLMSAIAVGDRRSDFDAFAAAMLADLAPEGAVETMLAARAVGLAWRLNRAQALEAAFLSQPSTYGAKKSRLEAGLDRTRETQVLEGLQRWEAGLQRALRALLDDLAARRGARVTPEGDGVAADGGRPHAKSTREASTEGGSAGFSSVAAQATVALSLMGGDSSTARRRSVDFGDRGGV